MLILGLETSCDETGIALYDKKEDSLLAHSLFSQADQHAIYGGVVPELASRDHIRRIIPLVEEVTKNAKCSQRDIEGVAYTAGPGLFGSLLVGATFAKFFALGLNIPALGINHMEGHLLAPMLEKDKPDFPFIALLVSGGHTLLVRVDGLGCYRILGESLDDAVGEAFDKVSRMLDLGYPGGPFVANLAESGDPNRYRFPRPMLDRPGLDFSFSGLKTHVLGVIKQRRHEKPLDEKEKADIARGFEDAAIESLVVKCKRALKQEKICTLVIGGGVGANRRLRSVLTLELENRGIKTFYPSPKFCTDNGAMIAFVGAHRISAGERDLLGSTPNAKWSLEDLKPLPSEQYNYG
ncbi:MAG: tRNA (adenosine(37)-N6)-threonylcarbamoyltransferase complex transferase subunit TsaD [Halieaceae bacterium]|nr:tRNA (adenosine(37)-N6)-threonylcarbamoyltransferase complex transferase subunit TsaD [Halieaceae bacterium]